jgi:hypothetical protein
MGFERANVTSLKFDGRKDSAGFQPLSFMPEEYRGDASGWNGVGLRPLVCETDLRRTKLRQV